MDKMKLQEENKDLIKEIEMYQIEIERLKSLLIDGDPIGCHVDGRSVIGDKRPLFRNSMRKRLNSTDMCKNFE